MIKPPYGLLAAISLDRGEVIWQTPHGDTPDAVRNNPALRGKTIPKTGQPATSGVGLLVTKTLVIMGDPQITAPPGRPRGAMLRAYDKKTGQQVGELWMPAAQWCPRSAETLAEARTLSEHQRLVEEQPMGARRQ